MWLSKSYVYGCDRLEKQALCELLVPSKTPYVAIDERGLVRSIHLFLFSCVP